MDKHREKQCTSIKDLSWMCVGIKYVLLGKRYGCHNQLLFRRATRSSQAVLTMQDECSMWLLVRRRR